MMDDYHFSVLVEITIGPTIFRQAHPTALRW